MMSTDKHEDWTATFDAQGGYDSMTAAWTIRQGKNIVAVVDYANWNAEHFDSTPIKQADNVARLIAAAPELFEACKAGLESLVSLWRSEFQTRGEHQPENRDPAVVQMKAAIAKAEGREP